MWYFVLGLVAWAGCFTTFGWALGRAAAMGDRALELDK